WDEISFRAAIRNHSEFKMQALSDPTMDADATFEYSKIRQEFEGTDDELRRAVFGDRCFFCRVRDDEKRIVLHRKDGRLHSYKLTSQVKYFLTLDPNNWVVLCQKHHRYVHWAMDTLGLKWDYLKVPIRKSDGAEGEI
ncbi:MAG: hypothetical protein EAX87_15005, partial [Candidatus Thorarchaeota archaeon]|nr:hypothetical protein [Candidatus Thorarchaeota archaeon]